MEFASGNLYIRPLQFANNKAGDVVDGHEHNFDHTTYVIRGAIRIEKLDKDDNVIKVVDKKASDGFNWVLIEAGVRHRLTALEDNSAGHCIYAHRNPQGEIVEQYDGWAPAYN